MATTSPMIPNTPATIRDLRARLDMTQQQFAGTIGVSVSTVRHWEQGTGHPGPDKIARMRYLATDRTVRSRGIVATLREVATHAALDGSEGLARELRRLADAHEHGIAVHRDTGIPVTG